MPLNVPTQPPTVDYAADEIYCHTPACQVTASHVSQTLDLTFDPCYDFYHYACGNRSDSKIANNLVEFTKNMVTINQRLLELIQEPSTYGEAIPISVAKDYYKECMNTDAIERRGLEPLKRLLAQFGGWPIVEGSNWVPTYNWVELTREFVRAGHRSGFLVDLEVTVNTLNPARHNRIIKVSWNTKY